MNIKPKCKLSGADGNVFVLAGRVSKALRRAGLEGESIEFRARLLKCNSYDEALQLMMSYVEIE